MDAVVQLARETVVEGRPFAAPANTTRDTAVMQEMLARMRAAARSWHSERLCGFERPGADGEPSRFAVEVVVTGMEYDEVGIADEPGPHSAPRCNRAQW